MFMWPLLAFYTVVLPTVLLARECVHCVFR